MTKSTRSPSKRSDRKKSAGPSTSPPKRHPSRSPETGKYPIASEEELERLLGGSDGDYQISLGLKRRK